MNWEQGIVLAMLMVIVTCLLTTRIKPAYLFAGAAFIGYQTDMIDLVTLAGNFTNSSLLTLVLLILVSIALEKTRLISWVGQQISEEASLA